MFAQVNINEICIKWAPAWARTSLAPHGSGCHPIYFSGGIWVCPKYSASTHILRQLSGPRVSTYILYPLRCRLQDKIRCAKDVLGRMLVEDKEGGSRGRPGRRGITSKSNKYYLWKSREGGNKKEDSRERASDWSIVSRKFGLDNEAFLSQNHPLEMSHVLP